VARDHPLDVNPARPAPGALLCRLGDIPDPGARGFNFRAGDALFAGFVVRTGGEVRGYEDRCPHAAMPLALLPHRYLTREGDLILCASHGALFRPADGQCVAGPCAGRALTPWPVRLDGPDLMTA
jgi:nitrite reductase/ring-hydroxylating ferredoxin subunit